MPDRRQLNLNLFIYPDGHHEAAWRYREAEIGALTQLGWYQALAQRAEAAKMDAVFFADGPVLAQNIAFAPRFRLEPTTLLTGIAAATQRIGLIATASTTYHEPYNLARLFSSVDHLSGGRAGWNIVTTTDAGAAQNFGLPEHPPHAERYARAEEFLEVVTALWDSWEDDAVIADQASGRYADPAKIHRLDHAGQFFKVRGPLNSPRSPQGRPVYVQAGSSEDGRGFAARWAEAIFTAHQTLDSAQEFYADIKARAAGLGRRPEQVKVLPGLSPFIGGTEAEAKRLQAEFDALVQPGYALQQLGAILGVDVSREALDAPFPEHLIPRQGPRAAASRLQLVAGIVAREKPTLRELLHKLAGARGHFVLAGTPEQIAGHIETWFTQGAADGFNIMPPWMPGGFHAFAAEVIPLLRRRGLFREEYTGTTLREHYGLDRPESLFAAGARRLAS
ncbi:LLM class flavin-dependent oxidoreductase [Siccirubricoccus phaeus]|uniref:LLM class flavin-dependent oxidoreductase n=1 Tax=Siccirubricoccus phaeus TaxID=2595053 RepID=UPI0011F2BAB1|nr:LLM class flavin-dependent oxidoreductase [Siccirubricoccus phaeus]